MIIITDPVQIEAELQKRLADKPRRGGRIRPIKWQLCADGLVFSMQAGKRWNCTPQQDTGPWSEVEMAFFSREVPEIEESGWDGEASWVPIETVVQIIVNAGGLMPKTVSPPPL